MIRSKVFTENEAKEIRILIKQKESASKDKKKGIRHKIREIGFHYSDFSSSKKGYTVLDFDNLIKSGQIRISNASRSLTNIELPKIIKQKSMKVLQNDEVTNVEKQLIANANFKQYSQLNTSTLGKTGFYCLRLKQGAALPKRYQEILNEREHTILYIGIAKGQSLKKRLGQEIEHTSPGTFFRSIGAVLGYLPIKGHLLGHSNQNNYKFSAIDTSKIISWLLLNVEISIVAFNGDFSIEKEIISAQCPFLNDKHNHLKLQVLQQDKANCRAIARSK